MAKGRRRSDRGTVAVLPDEIILWEILVRVPAKELLRCRAACRSWRSVTSDASFLLAHHRIQPSLPLVKFEADYLACRTVDALDLRQSPAVRRPVLGFNDGHGGYPHGFHIRASSDGLLLLSFSTDHRFHLCNPATRQWLTLWDLCGSNVAALYPHRPSGEYRVLYWKPSNDVGSYYVLTVGSSQGRCIGLPVASPSMKNHTGYWGIHGGHRSVLLHGCVYWYNNNNSRDHNFDSKIVIFDTVAESFSWMQPPAATGSADVLQIDGTLGIAHVDLDAMTVVAWVLLQDHEKEIWSSKFRVKLPYEGMRKDVKCLADFLGGMVVSENGDMLLIGENFHPFATLFHKLLCDNSKPAVLPFRFKESLVRHAFFNNRKENGRRVRMPSFLRGLY